MKAGTAESFHLGWQVGGRDRETGTENVSSVLKPQSP